MRGLRAILAGVALLGGMISFCGNHKSPLSMDKLGISLIPKTANVVAAKGIAIVNFPGNEYWLGIVHNRGIFVNRDGRAVLSGYPPSPLFRGINYEPLACVFRHRWRAAYSDTHEDTELIGRSLPKIFDMERNDRYLPETDTANGSLYDSNVRSQLAFSDLLCAPNEIAGCYPKEDGRKSQNYSEGYENFVLPIVDKITETVPVNIGLNHESGEIIFRFSIGGLFLVLLYAGLKRWGPL